jgi:hypothetical protein
LRASLDGCSTGFLIEIVVFFGSFNSFHEKDSVIPSGKLPLHASGVSRRTSIDAPRDPVR